MSLEPADGNPAPYRCKHNCERDELMDRIAALTAEVARKDEALRFAHSWLGYWATHIGNCRGGQVCTCGLTRVRYDARAALEARND
jgi:hypothetical protein